MTVEEAKNHLLNIFKTLDATTQTALKVMMAKSEFMTTQIIDNDTIEEWRDIENYDGIYQIR